MQILKNFDKNITIDAQGESDVLFVFDEGKKKEYTISINTETKVNLAMIGIHCAVSITIICNNPNGECTIYGIFWAKKANTKVEVQTNIITDHCIVNKHLISIIAEEWSVDMNWNIYIQQWCKKVIGHLLEENISIGKHTKIKALPMLDIHSNDVVASHGVKIDQIDKKKLFYLQSRGIRFQQAQRLIIESYLSKVLSIFNDLSDADNIQIQKEFLEKIW